MPMHIIKLAVGSTGLDSIERFQSTRLIEYGGQKATWISTRNRPKQEAEVLNGGSLYWVLKSKIICRQRIIGFEDKTDEEGKKYCHFILDPTLHATAPKPFRPFQGWRYFKDSDIPADLENGETITGFGEMPQDMIKDLQDMGLV